MLAICGMECVSYNLGNDYSIVVRRVGTSPFGMEAGFSEGIRLASLKRCQG
jgi:hypothetical protein